MITFEGDFDPDLKGSVIESLKEIYDPEIPVNIVDLGLIYRLAAEGQNIEVDMTLTSPGCPVAGEMPHWVGAAIANVEGVEHVKVNLVWEPQWGQGMMSEEARLELGLF
ncbi:MAG: iron-sulfur cluster assembly protein [Pseudomonadota bacterium]